MIRAALFAALCLVAAGAAAAGPPETGQVEPLRTAQVEMREVDLSYTAEAVVEAVRQSTVSAQIAGRIVDLRFDVGDHVEKGQGIARIDERAPPQAAAASVAQVREAPRPLAGIHATKAETTAPPTSSWGSNRPTKMVQRTTSPSQVPMIAPKSLRFDA